MSNSSIPPAGKPITHFVSKAPFDPYSIEEMTKAQEKLYLASQWKLMWWKFRQHRIAVYSGIFLLILYFSIFFSEIIAPYNLHARHTDHVYAPPQGIHLFHEGEFVGPFIYGFDYRLNMENLKREYTVNTNKVQPLRFFCSGESYKFWGTFKSTFHLICPAENGSMFILGTDRLGRDVLSRIIYGARISLTIGLFGVAISFILGIVIGGLAGYYGGITDMIVQRIIEVLQSLPSIPLWLALATIMPITWSPILVYFGITIILGMLDWTGLARAVRSKLLSLREEDYVLAAQLMGAKPSRDYCASPDPWFYEPFDRHCHHLHSDNGIGRNRTQFSWPRPTSANYKLGCVTRGSAKYQRCRAVSMADVTSCSGDPCDPGIQFSRGWT